MICPSARCRAENDAAADQCRKCGLPLAGLARLHAHPAALFNRGLEAAQGGQFGEARELFAAVVHWCPRDVEARNALALACLRHGDPAAARRHWEDVLARVPGDDLATRGLRALAQTQPVRPAAAVRLRKRRRRGQKPGHRRHH